MFASSNAKLERHFLKTWLNLYIAEFDRHLPGDCAAKDSNHESSRARGKVMWCKSLQRMVLPWTSRMMKAGIVLMWASLSGHYEIASSWSATWHLCRLRHRKGRNGIDEGGRKWTLGCLWISHWRRCQVNQLDQHHQTALMWAASEGHLTTVQGLVKKDAKVDQVTKQGKTALLLAAQFGREEICKFLVAKGAKDGAPGRGWSNCSLQCSAGRQPESCEESH